MNVVINFQILDPNPLEISKSSASFSKSKLVSILLKVHISGLIFPVSYLFDSPVNSKGITFLYDFSLFFFGTNFGLAEGVPLNSSTFEPIIYPDWNFE